MLKKYALFVFATISFIFISCEQNESKENSSEKTKELTPVTVIEAKSSDYFVYGSYYGRVQGAHRASIISTTGGTVESVNVVEGSAVSKGDSLGLISSDKARLSLDSAKLNEKINRDNYQALSKFLTRGTSSQINVDQAHLQWLNSQTQLLEAEKAYNGSFNISPINGVVVSRNIDEDEEVPMGHESFLVEDLSEIEIKIGIPEADMEGIHEGSPAEITIDLYPGRIWEGTLTRYSRRSADSNLTFSATIIVENADRAILSGTTAKVKLLRKSFINQIILPSDSVSKDEVGAYVMIVHGEIVKKQYIEVGSSNISECVVLSGVDEGEIIVQEGLDLIMDSQNVTIINQDV